MTLKVLDILVKVFSLVFVVFLMIATFAGLFPSLKCDIAALIATISLFIALVCANWYNSKQRKQMLSDTHIYLFTFRKDNLWRDVTVEAYSMEDAYKHFQDFYNNDEDTAIFNIVKLE